MNKYLLSDSLEYLNMLYEYAIKNCANDYDKRICALTKEYLETILKGIFENEKSRSIKEN